MASNPDKVTVNPPGQDALGRPNFIVEMEDGFYYLTLAVVEYNEANTGGDARKEEGVANIRRLFEQGVAAKPLRACLVVAPAAPEAAGLAGLDGGPGVNTRAFGVNTK
jgi:hypothetical protein